MHSQVSWDAENVLEGEELSSPVLLVALAESLINEKRCLPHQKNSQQGGRQGELVWPVSTLLKIIHHY